jgi:hypothetical protein
MQPGPIWGQKKELPPKALRGLYINIVEGLESNIRMGRGQAVCGWRGIL